TILLADDHPLLLRALAELLSHDPHLRIVARCPDGATALDAATRLQPDLAIVDVKMPGLTGLQFLSAVQSAGLSTRVVLLTGQLGDDSIFDAVAGGVAALVFKDAVPDDLLGCIHHVLAGERWF